VPLFDSRNKELLGVVATSINHSPLMLFLRIHCHIIKNARPRTSVNASHGILILWPKNPLATDEEYGQRHLTLELT